MVADTIKRLLGRERRTHAVPEGTRVYAIGDVHGRLDLFETLVGRVREDAAGGAAEIVLLGDYVDRGPDSAGLVERLVAPAPAWARWTMLRGNHEQAMLDAAGDGPDARRVLRVWLDNGGRETLRSYGTSAVVAYSDDLDVLDRELRARVPARHLDFLRRLPLSHRVGDYLFVHAGIRPGVALAAQEDRDLLWIREDFLDSRDDHGFVVVHGHSITRDVAERDNRIGIDTGAYATGRLTALVLEGETRRYLST